MMNADAFKGWMKEIVDIELNKLPTDKIGRIDPNYSSGLPKIKFDGEAVVSGKGYPCLSSYKPIKNDRVLLRAVKGSYVVLGTINISEWKNIPLRAPAEPYSATTIPQYCIKGGVVYLRGASRNLTERSTVIGVLPVGARPIEQEHYFVQSASAISTSARIARWVIRTNGEIFLEFVTDNTISTGNWFPINTSFLL